MSIVTGEAVAYSVDYLYWRTNLESPVHSSKAVQNLVKKSRIYFVEIGPHSVLELPIKQCVSTLKFD